MKTVIDVLREFKVDFRINEDRAVHADRLPFPPEIYYTPYPNRVMEAEVLRVYNETAPACFQRPVFMPRHWAFDRYDEI